MILDGDRYGVPPVPSPLLFQGLIATLISRAVRTLTSPSFRACGRTCATPGGNPRRSATDGVDPFAAETVLQFFAPPRGEMRIRRAHRGIPRVHLDLLAGLRVLQRHVPTSGSPARADRSPGSPPDRAAATVTASSRSKSAAWKSEIRKTTARRVTHPVQVIAAPGPGCVPRPAGSKKRISRISRSVWGAPFFGGMKSST